MTTVADLITDARNFVNGPVFGVLGAARTALSNAYSRLEDSNTAITYVLPTLPTSPQSEGLGLVAPVFTPIILNLPVAPGEGPMYQDISPIDTKLPKEFIEPAPIFDYPNKPSEVPYFNVIAPLVLTEFEFPVTPPVLDKAGFGPPKKLTPAEEAKKKADELLYGPPPDPNEPPKIEPNTAPVKPYVALPNFDVARPDNIGAAPTNIDSRFNTAYRDASPSMKAAMDGHVDAQLTKLNPNYHEQMGRIETQLSTYLDGGTGLKPAVEDAIYSRAREKNDREAERVRDAAYVEAANRGFTLPSGALLATVARARQEAANNNLKAASDIVVMQAEMEQKNLQFAVTTSIGLRTVVLNALMNYMQNLATLNGQALDYAKSILSAIIEAYNIEVKAFGLKLDAYKAEAAVFEIRLKSAMAGIELYLAEIKALEALTQVDKLKLETFRTRAEALKLFSEIFKMQIDAVIGKASLEKMKIELYRDQVMAHGTLVQAKNAEWQGYTAVLGGQESRAKVFSSQVQAYNAELQSYQVRISSQADAVKAIASTNDARARQYSAAMSGYEAAVRAETATVSANIEGQRGVLTGFQAQVGLATANARSTLDVYNATATNAMQTAKQNLEGLVATSKSNEFKFKSIAQIASAEAGMYAQTSAAALSGINTLVAQSE